MDLNLGKRERTKAANRQAILDAARRVFARIGYEASNIRDIIRETELASGTFYNYFKSKEEVFDAIANDSVKRFRPLLEKVRAEASDFQTYMLQAYRAYFQFLADENDAAILDGQPHMALIGVRVDTPEMQTISQEIKADIGLALRREGLSHIDVDYLTAAAIGIAREVGDRMLQRRPLDAEATAQFATQLCLSGLHGLAKT